MNKINEGEKRVHRVAMSMKAGPKDLKRALNKLKRRRMKLADKKLGRKEVPVDESKSKKHKFYNYNLISRKLKSGEVNFGGKGKDAYATDSDINLRVYPNKKFAVKNAKHSQDVSSSIGGKGNKAKRRIAKLKESINYRIARILVEAYLSESTYGIKKVKRMYKANKGPKRTQKTVDAVYNKANNNITKKVLKSKDNTPEFGTRGQDYKDLVKKGSRKSFGKFITGR